MSSKVALGAIVIRHVPERTPVHRAILKSLEAEGVAVRREVLNSLDARPLSFRTYERELTAWVGIDSCRTATTTAGRFGDSNDL